MSLEFAPEEYNGVLERAAAYMLSQVRPPLPLEPLDVVQLVWERVIRTASRCSAQNRSGRLAWLIEILKNVVSDQRKYHGREKRDWLKETRYRGTGDSASEGSATPIPASLQLPSPSLEARRTQLGERLECAMEALSFDQSEALRLHYLEELSAKEVSERLGRSPDAVRALIRRGLQQLVTPMDELRSPSGSHRSARGPRK